MKWKNPNENAIPDLQCVAVMACTQQLGKWGMEMPMMAMAITPASSLDRLSTGEWGINGRSLSDNDVQSGKDIENTVTDSDCETNAHTNVRCRGHDTVPPTT